MPTLFTKNLTLAANAADIVEAAQHYMLVAVTSCGPGARCTLCHQPIRRSALLRFSRTQAERHIGLDCLERLDFIGRSGREPGPGELTAERRARRAWRNDRRRKPIVASAVAFFRQRREVLSSELRSELDFLESAGAPRTIADGERLLAYYRQADPFWLWRLVRQRRPDWRQRLGTIMTLRVMGAEEFRQIRALPARRSLLRLTVAGGHVHEWTYDAQSGDITIRRYTRAWYEECGNFSHCLPRAKTITIVFEEGRNGPIAFKPSDGGTCLVPDRWLCQQVTIGVRYEVAVTGTSRNGRVRFCKSLRRLA